MIPCCTLIWVYRTSIQPVSLGAVGEGVEASKVIVHVPLTRK